MVRPQFPSVHSCLLHVGLLARITGTEQGLKLLVETIITLLQLQCQWPLLNDGVLLLESQLVHGCDLREAQLFAVPVFQECQ